MTEQEALNKKFQKEITAGIAALVLLKTVAQGGEPMYGYQIAKLINPPDDRAPIIKQGALYPVLRSLEKSGLLQSKVEPSISGPPRRYYTLTPAGDLTLQDWTNLWEQTKTFVDQILEGASPGPQS